MKLITNNIRKILVVVALVIFLGLFASVAYNIGCLFAQCMCLAMAFLSIYYGKLKGKYITVIMNVLIIGFLILLVWCFVMFGLIIKGQYSDETPENSVVIVLGAKVNQDAPSLSFKVRLDAAYEYLMENPTSVCITTGGKGYDEPEPEGDAGYKYLLQKGIEKDRIYIENISSSTYENFLFSLEIIEENNFSKNIVIATHDFHMYRARQIADDLGYTTYGVCAKSGWYMYPSYYTREILALTKYFLQQII